MSQTDKNTDALTQYRELLDRYGDLIADNTAEPVGDARRQAARRLVDDKTVVLPRKGDEGFEYTDLNRMMMPDMGVNIKRLPPSETFLKMFRCGMASLSSLSGFVVNDFFILSDELSRRLPEGAHITAFSNAGPRWSPIIRKYYGTVASDNEAMTLLNTALAQDGLLIYLEKGVKITKPLQIINLLQPISGPDGTEMPVLALRRILVVLEENSQCSVMVCDHSRDSGTQSVSTRVTEVALAPGASLKWYDVEETGGTSGRYTRFAARQGADSRLELFTGTLRPGTTRNDIDVRLEGKGATLSIDGMVIADNAETADNSTTVRHLVSDCESHQRFKYLLRGESRGAFEGLIKVEPGAARTNASQTNRNIIADTGARMHAQPQLEIYCDDVKCGHGSATGQLDERALFYMRSRGIDLEQARTMLMNAFMADVIDSVDFEPMRNRLKHLVNQRLSGNEAACDNCSL